MNDVIKKAEQRGYARGYQAGRKRVKSDPREEGLHSRRDANWNRAFLVALEATVVSGRWMRGDKALTSVEDYINTARYFANQAVKVMK